MAKDTNKPIVIDGVEYSPEDLTEAQLAMVNHVVDLDRKVSRARFNLDQLVVGREAFMRSLRSSLDNDDESRPSKE